MAQLARRTPPHGSAPGATQDRVKSLLKAALDDEQRGQLQSAETNVRLALAFGGSVECAHVLKRLVDAREQARRKAAR